MNANVIFEYTIEQAIADGVLYDATEIPIPEQPLFPLGRVVITSNANDRLAIPEVTGALARHARGDWGDLCREDISQNNWAIREGARLLSAYRIGTETFWIITEADRSITTILMPEDY